jgi:hypothetical protein
MAIITNIKDLESLHLEPVSNEDMKVILESLRTNKKLYINNKNLKVTTKYRNHKDEESIANIVEDLDFREFHSKSKREYVYKVGRIIDFKDIENKHKIWEIEEKSHWTYKKIRAGEIVILRKCGEKEYYLGIGKSASCYMYGLSLFKINNIQKAKELIYRYKLLELLTDDAIELIKELSEKAV